MLQQTLYLSLLFLKEDLLVKALMDWKFADAHSGWHRRSTSFRKELKSMKYLCVQSSVLGWKFSRGQAQLHQDQDCMKWVSKLIFSSLFVTICTNIATVLQCFHWLHLNATACCNFRAYVFVSFLWNVNFKACIFCKWKHFSCCLEQSELSP